ncbi:MAG TPA: hypothetical protein DIC34_14225 [Treponema sp.]|nr:MAG: hypothetical protein A2001_10115 [Treponema sp. GWC1_61_84]HCM27678.1 hypothetical protein [Treponema sp.]
MNKRPFRSCPAFLLVALLAVAFSPLQAAGLKETELTPAEGDTNWKHSFDISGKKPGVYNILVQGKDSAGNMTLAGPINVFVDPKSDLPIAVIANPLSGMRVGGDLNIVGTCVDDDAVAKVELRVDDGEWFPAEGADFWSSYVRAGQIPDGSRKLTVRGTDINGLAGPEHSVRFDMDRTKPLASFDSHAAGSLVAGRINLKGKVFDANGVDQAEYSLDGGKTYAEAKGTRDRKAGTRTFSAPIDTSKLADGPTAIFIRARDGVGSIGVTPFLLVVDNTEPKVELISPASGEVVDGDFTLFGVARDDVGIRTLSWKIGDAGGEVALTQGDPFWSVPISLAQPKGKDIAILLTAIDTIGNRTELRLRQPLDMASDDPSVVLLEPKAGGSAASSFLLAGFARDDDAVQAVEYWVDKGAPARITTTGGFSAMVDGLAPGAHTIQARAIDVKGRPGPVSTVSVAALGAPPAVRIAEVVSGAPGKDAQAVPFVPGMELAPDAKASFRIVADAGAKLASFEWTMSGGVKGSAVAKSAGEQVFLIPVPATGPYGALDLEIAVKDIHGRSASARSHFYVTNYSAVRGEPAFVYADERLGAEGNLSLPPASDGGAGLSSTRPFVSRFIGAALAKAELDPPDPSLSLTVDGQLVRIAATAEVADVPFRLVATTDRGHVFSTEPFLLTTDRTAPAIDLEPRPSPFVGNTLRIAGRARDATGMAEFKYVVSDASGGKVASGEIPADPESGEFAVEADLRNAADGALRGIISATDGAGNEATAFFDAFKDTEGPLVDFLLPSGPVGGPLVAMHARDSGGLASLSWSADGDNFIKVEGREAFVFALDQSKAPRPRVKAVDRAGNERVVPIPGFTDVAAADAPATDAPAAEAPAAPATEAGVAEAPAADAGVAETVVAAEADVAEADVTAPPESTIAAPPQAPATVDPKAVPLVELLSPTGAIDGDAILAFRLVSPRPVASISWTFGSQKGIIEPSVLIPLDSASSAGAGGSFMGAVIVTAYQAKAGAVQCSVSVKDAAGKTGSATPKSPVTFDPTVSLPSVSFDSPEEGGKTASIVDLSFSASSRSGIASYRIVLDGGSAQSLESVSGAKLRTAALPSGLHTATVVAVDALGRESVSVKRSFRVVGGEPAASIAAVVRKDSRQEFIDGGTLIVDAGMSLEGVVSAPEGLASVEVRIGRKDPVKATVKKLSSAEFAWSAPLPADLGYERNEISVESKDGLGRNGLVRSFFYRVAPPFAGGEALEAEGLRATDTRLETGKGSDGSMLMRFYDDAPLRLRFAGRPLESVSTEPASGLVSLSLDGSSIVITPAGEGVGTAAVVKARTIDGDLFEWGPVSFTVDRAEPAFELAEPVDDAWYRRSIPFSGVFSDVNGISSASYSLDGGDWRELSFDEVEKDARRGMIEMDKPDGGIVARFRVVDAAGRETSIVRVFNLDATPPAGFIPIPRTTDSVNGRTTLASRWTDGGAIALIEFSTDGGATWEKSEAPSAMVRQVDFAVVATEGLRFRATDAAGNTGAVVPGFIVDPAADKPRAVVQLPEENEVLRNDFEISGAVYDDDAVASISWRIDGGDWIKAAIAGNSFSMPVSLADSADNEHHFEAFAEDMYGVSGDTVLRTYRISKEEPKAAVLEPGLDKTVRGAILVSGDSSDANGVRDLTLSFDNAVSFNMTEGAEAWSYRLDTRNLKDGLHSVYIRPTDTYDTEGFYASLISVDNTPPEVSLDVPKDGAIVDKALALSGRASDSRALASCEAVVFSRGDRLAEKRFDLGLDPVISRVLDLAGLSDGEYGISIVARDKAGNETTSSRDFSLKAGWRDEEIAIAAPVRGERLSGRLRVQGRLRSPSMPSVVTIFVDGRDFASGPPDKNGWFSVDLDPGLVGDGKHVVEARFQSDAGSVVLSEKVEIEFAEKGPWVLADSFAPGSFVPSRPWISGSAGWESAETAKVKAHEVAGVEVSLDNGRTFARAKGGAKWKFRLETLEYREGKLPLVFRTRFRDGTAATSKLQLNLDKTLPAVRILSPEEGGRFNGAIDSFGIASDEVKLVAVDLVLRDGDKAGYQLPTFIQGLYLDTSFLGGTQYNVGAGLTFFDDNVKLQAMYGYTPEAYGGSPQRFFGDVFSGKLLANLATFPFSFVLGPDWDFLQAAFAVGADFSYFTETSGGDPLMLSAVIAQVEFPKVTIRKWPIFSSYSLFAEYQAWFISAEVEGGIQSKLSFGLRTSVF